MRASDSGRDIKLLALDLDGTTLRPDGTLGERTARAVYRAAAAGIEVVPATGRAFSTLPREIREMECIHYAITSNGAAVCRTKTGERVYSSTVDSAEVMRVLQEVEGRENVCLEVFIDGLAYGESRYVSDPARYSRESAVYYVQHTRIPVDDIKKLILENIDKLDAVDIVCRERQLLLQMEENLRRDMEGSYLTSSVPYLIEISSARSGKANGVEYIQKILGCTWRETAACGNADNDADMLRLAGLGAAVRDGTEKCIAAAKLLIGTGEEDGVADFIAGILSGELLQWD